MADELRCSIEDRIATVTLNRPERRNALNQALLDALRGCFTDLEDNPAVRVIVVRAAGAAFCSGMDLGELSGRQGQEADPEGEVIKVFQQIERSRHPTIAMVHGDAFAGGCELALHCDLRVAAEGARFAMPLARIGMALLFPLVGKLVESIGPAFAREILLTGQPVSAVRAREMGMVHRVVPPAELDGATSELARAIAGNAPLSLAALKAMIQRVVSMREKVEHADLDEMVRGTRKSADAREGVRAMLEKRAPDFRGV